MHIFLKYISHQIGQYSAMGPAVVYKHISPVFKVSNICHLVAFSQLYNFTSVFFSNSLDHYPFHQGLGFANIFAQSFVGLYYNMVIISLP